MSAPSPDAPISKPEDDLYGVEPFARALAKSMADMKAPEGIVIGVNGGVGLGKDERARVGATPLGRHT